MMLVIILLTAGALLIFREVYARLWARGIEVQLTVEEPFVYAGETAHFTETVANRGRIPLPEIEVRFRFPQGPVFRDAENVILSDHLYKRDIFALRPMEKVTRRYIMQCPRRGRYPVSDLTVRAMSFWHSRSYELRQNTAALLTVYAAHTDVSGILAHCDTILGSLESRRRTYEDPFAWASIRAYTPQDPMRSVNWKASARTGGLMVNTYASVQAAQFCIFLDVVDDRIIREEDLTELGISAAASLARRLIGRGREAGLYIYTDMPSLQPGESPGAQAPEPKVQQTSPGAQAPDPDEQQTSPGGQAPDPDEQQTSPGGQAAGRIPRQLSPGLRIPPSRGRSQLTMIEQALTSDLTGYLGRKSGQAADIERSRSGPALPGFPEWAMRLSQEEASEHICVFISKDGERLKLLEDLWRRAGTARAVRQSVPAVLVRPVSEDGVNRLRSVIIE